MNLVDGAMTFLVPIRNNASLARSEDVACHMEAVSQGDLAAVLARNLVITRGLHAMDTLLLMLHVREVQNFEWWECSVAAEEAPAQDLVKEEPQQALGARGQLPSGSMLSIWRVLKQFAQLLPSG